MPAKSPTSDAAPPGGSRPARLVTHLAWALKLFAISCFSILLFYVVVGNLFLTLGGLKWLASRDPQTFTMDYTSAWTYWPAHA